MNESRRLRKLASDIEQAIQRGGLGDPWKCDPTFLRDIANRIEQSENPGELPEATAADIGKLCEFSDLSTFPAGNVYHHTLKSVNYSLCLKYQADAKVWYKYCRVLPEQPDPTEEQILEDLRTNEKPFGELPESHQKFLQRLRDKDPRAGRFGGKTPLVWMETGHGYLIPANSNKLIDSYIYVVSTEPSLSECRTRTYEADRQPETKYIDVPVKLIDGIWKYRRLERGCWWTLSYAFSMKDFKCFVINGQEQPTPAGMNETGFVRFVPGKEGE